MFVFTWRTSRVFYQHASTSIQGRSQVSKQDEASLERRRREPLGGSGGMPPQKILQFRGSELLF